MPRSNNILQFPKTTMKEAPLKLFAMLFYLFIAAMMTKVLHGSDSGILFLLALGLLYHFALRKPLISQNYFKQNNFLLIILFLLALFVFPMTLIPIFAIALVYWLLIGRTQREAPYFTRFHVLTALILNFLILISFLLLFATTGFIHQALLLLNIQTSLFSALNFYGRLLEWGCFWGAAIWLSITALFGRTPYIGLVTNNIRHWA